MRENGANRKKKEAYKVMMKLISESVRTINPLKWTKVLKKKLGKIDTAKMLRDNRMLLFCKDEKQQKAALGLKYLMGQKILN